MKKQYNDILTTEVTSIGNWWHCRVWFKNKDGVESVVSETKVNSKELIGQVLREDLRMLNKCGFDSDIAINSRHREKERTLKLGKVIGVSFLGTKLKGAQ